MELSVIIPAFNAGKTIDRCLQGIKDQEHAAEFEVLVVESGDGGYASELAGRYPGARFILAPSRLFSGQARNVGAGYSSGRTLVFLDADCRPLPDWLNSLSASHESGFDVVCGALANGTPRSLVGTAEYLVSKSFYSPAMPHGEIADSTASSANMSVRREMFDAAGGFPGTERANDFLFSRRLHALGARVVFNPRAAALHSNPDALMEFTRGQVSRGYWNAKARIGLGIEGSIAGRFPPLSFMLFFLRLYRMAARCVRFGVVTRTRLVEELPLCALGVGAWTWGYFTASLEESAGLEEKDPLPDGWEDFEVIRSESRKSTGPSHDR